MTWNNIAEFTLSQAWQYTAPIDGRIFRIRHLQTPASGRALIGQATTDGQALQLFDLQRLTAKLQHDLLDFLPPLGLEGDRRIAAKLVAFDQDPWTIAIDVLEPANPQEEQDLLDWLTALLATKEDLGAVEAHEALVNPHPAISRFLELTTPANSSVFYDVTQPSRLVLKNNSSVWFDLTIIGRQVNSSTSAIWTCSGLIRRGANAASTAFVSAPSITRRSADASANFNTQVIADTINRALGIQCRSATGQLTGTSWKVRATLTEVF